MTIEGVDYSWGRPAPADLAAEGKRFAVRYLSYSDTGKNLTAAEADALIAEGVAVVSNWEWDHADALGGYPAGVEYAREAMRQHEECGGPPDAPIYFSVDFDMGYSDESIVADYFAGVASVLPFDRIGVYGGYDTIVSAVDQGWARWLWQTYAWSYGQWHPAAHIQQYENGVIVAGAEVDLNRATDGKYGQWGIDDMTAKDVWYVDGMIGAARPPVNNADYYDENGDLANTEWSARYALQTAVETGRHVHNDTRDLREAVDILLAQTAPGTNRVSAVVDPLLIVLIGQLLLLGLMVWLFH
jgi:hypothetical protein